MIIQSIKLKNFRNYENLELELNPGTNIFYGENAQGKTNILESVYVCGTTKSHRGSRDSEMIRFGQEEAHICMQIVRKDIPFRIDMHLKKNKKKGIAINGVPIKKAGELIGLGNFVFFSPEDLNIIKDGPAERRRFMDMELCQLSALYVQSLSNYNHILMQRNKLLKDIYFHPELKDTLDIWDEQLVNYAEPVISMRRKFADRINELASSVHSNLSGGKEKLSVSYEMNVSEDGFSLALASNRDRDLLLKTTNSGLHRDDLMIKVNDIDVRRFGSQGQQRTAALSLKLAEIELSRIESGDVPVLLLDDVLSELDKYRQHFLLESIDQIQTLITCTGVEDFTANKFTIDRLFNVKCGIVREDMNGR